MHPQGLAVWLLLCYAQCAALISSYETILNVYYHRGNQFEDRPLAVDLGKDTLSGCYCRATERSQAVVVCFGGYDCRKIPAASILDEHRTTRLRVRTTDIREIRTGELDGFYFLRVLELESNHYLKSIEPGSFRNLSMLEDMSISNSPTLSYLHENTFKGLDNLRNLTLVNNAFMSLIKLTPAFHPSHLPALRSVDISENFFEHISNCTFHPMKGSQLRALILNFCQIDYIHPDALLPLTSLKELTIAGNDLNITVIKDLLNNTLRNEVRLQHLDLSKLGFRKHPPRPILDVIANSTIERLILSENQFEFILENSFPRMPNLQLLDLSKVSSVYVAPAAFTPQDFPSLKVLLLNGNSLSGIHSAHLLQQLVLLDLSHNAEANGGNTIYFEISKDNFALSNEMRILNLSYNTIKSIFDYTFRGLYKLKILNMENGTLYRIGMGTFLSTPELEILNLANNPIRASENLTSAQFVGLNKLRILMMGNCGIRQFHEDSIFKSMPNLTHLFLKNNQLYLLTPDLFEPLHKLQVLDVSENLLVPWIDPIFYPMGPRLHKFLLRNNKLSAFSVAMLNDMNYLLDDLRGNELDLGDNIFVCDCTSMYTAYVWIETNGSHALHQYFEVSKLQCRTPDVWEDRTVHDYLRSIKIAKCLMYEKVTNVMILMWTTPTVISLIFVIIGAIAVMRYKVYIKYWLFLAKLALGRRFTRYSTIIPFKPKEYKYDAFISYSNEDREFVLDLVSRLETEPPYLKLCVYERDFELGSFISESILSSINDSRYIILVVSDAFARSQWCRWETQLAEYHRLFLEDGSSYDPLILIRVGSIDNKSLNPTLKFLLKTKVYLSWSESHSEEFWKRLRNILHKTRPNIT